MAEFVNVRSDRLADDLRLARGTGGLVRLSRLLGFTEPDLSCIRGAGWIRHLHLYHLLDCRLDDVAGLSGLKSLEVSGDFDLETRLSLDLGNTMSVSTLDGLSIPWWKSVRWPPVETPLKGLSVEEFRSALEGIEELPVWPTLRVLAFSRGVMRDMSGLERMRGLESLSLFRARNLLSLEEAADLPALKRIRIERCARLRSLRGFERCSSLERIALVDCPELSSLQPLKNLPRLHTLELIRVPGLAAHVNELAHVPEVVVSPPRPEGPSRRRRRLTSLPLLDMFRVSLPTVAWKERMQAGDGKFSTMALVRARKCLMRFLDEAELATGNQAALNAAMKSIVEDFNRLNSEFAGLVEAREREELRSFLNNVAEFVGMHHALPDATQAWRREW